MSARSKRKIVLKNLKSHKTIWHPESTLVYKSRKERVVIGRYVDSELIPLDEEALDLCEKWNMKPDESLIDEGESRDEDDTASEEGGGDDDAASEDEAQPPESEEQKEEPPANKEVTQLDINRVVLTYNQHSTAFLSALSEWDSAQKAESAKKQVEYDELKDKYDTIKKKFDTMKSLFA